MTYRNPKRAVQTAVWAAFAVLATMLAIILWLIWSLLSPAG